MKKTGAEKLRDEIFSFFTHYRSIESKERYEVLMSPAFEKEFSEFEVYLKSYWSTKISERFYKSVYAQTW